LNYCAYPGLRIHGGLPFSLSFGLIGVIRAVRPVAASLANILWDFSSCYSFSSLPVEISMPIISSCVTDISGCVYSFSYWVPALAVVAFFWAFLAFFLQIFVFAIFSLSVLGSAVLSNSSFSFCSSSVFPSA